MAAKDTEITPQRWTIAVLAVFLLFGFGFGNWLARIPAVRDHLGASTFEMSVIGLVLASGSVLGLVFAGQTVTLIGPRRAILFGALGQAVFMPLGATLLWFDLRIPGMLALACFGFFFSTSDVAMNVSGAAAERALGKSRMPILHGGYSLGGVSAMGLGALAEHLRVPVPIHLAVVFAFIVAAIALAVRWIPRVEPTAVPDGPVPASTNTGPIHLPPLPPAPSGAPAAYNPWRDPRIIVIGLVAMSLSFTEGTATDWLPLALADHRGFSNPAAALALGVFFVAMLSTRAAGSVLLARFGRVTILRASAVTAGVGIVLMNVLPFTWAAYASAALWGIGSALGFPIGVSAAADDPAKAVRGVATVSAIAYAAFLIGPMAIGFLGEHFGLLRAFLPLIGLLVFVVFAARAAREPGAGPGTQAGRVETG
ncbi:MFS transporter [Leucobacter albus]|uniref:MFS transporter n=1 Tax=Leucobacter albus TaxID=272210 RepID=A0ABW3TKH6_9MICO